MSGSGLDVFDKTIQATNIWLGEIKHVLGPDRQVAWKVLATVLHKLRDRFPVEVAAHLSAQFSLLVRGVCYDQYQPAHCPNDCKTIAQFTAEIAEWLSDIRPVDPVDRASVQSFPASDPPGWIGTIVGGRSSAGQSDDIDAPLLFNDPLKAWIFRHWWVAAMRGVAALAFGLLAIAWPAITLITLVAVFAFASGFAMLGLAMQLRSHNRDAAKSAARS